MIFTFFIVAYPIPSVCCLDLIGEKDSERSKNTGIPSITVAKVHVSQNCMISLLDKTICTSLFTNVIFSIKSNKIKNKQPPLISNINIDLFVTSLTNPNRFFIILFHYLLQFNFDFLISVTRHLCSPSSRLLLRSPCIRPGSRSPCKAFPSSRRIPD